ncbi:helix-hairpin-helix domain-containing protein [Dyadobacter luteus]|uniref:Helix-hairpin-helix domain-containing protein n=1 Tax=Dyadobacter luteus TaxID=2259619 RepID=A0A3D8Y5V0_9BACT|nr:helix-hairpin-helix domain-containing protein [Dyadobacter luteus]REA55689.1 helix-hairpin-helix domain-containing protein [Dyadobacter luteus]
MIRKIISQLQDFFGISRKEARGALVLIILMSFLIWTPFVFRRLILPHFPIPFTEKKLNTQKLDSIVAELNKEAPEKPGFNNYEKKEFSKKAEKPIRLFPFDPNTASVEDLTTLGIPEFLAKRIEKYRSKGGKFRKKEDLLHIYDFPASTYKSLEPYITLSVSKIPVNSEKPVFTPDRKFADVPARGNNYVKPALVPFDINTADTTQLIKLKGIGSKLSVRILKFRDGLGGFHSTSQFSEIFGLDSVAVTELNKYAKIGTAVKKININTATVEELSSHSYLRNKKLANVIVNYRNQHGIFSSAEDLKKVKVLDAVTIEKLVPYLAY